MNARAGRHARGRRAGATVVAGALALVVSSAFAAEPPAPVAPIAATAAPVPKRAARGLAVVALDGATDAAWALAREVYANAALRPASIDDVHARVLAGEPPPANAPADVVDLSQIRAGIKGDDAASRQLLASIAAQLGVRGVLLVDVAGGKASARVFIADASVFDAARYAPDDTPLLSWNGAVQSLARSYAPAAPAAPAPATSAAPSAALHEGPRIENTPPASKKFYESAWFWGAIGAAVFAGGAVYFATRDNTTGTIHLQVKPPQ